MSSWLLAVFGGHVVRLGRVSVSACRIVGFS
jgi:hypothetical protein